MLKNYSKMVVYYKFTDIKFIKIIKFSFYTPYILHHYSLFKSSYLARSLRGELKPMAGFTPEFFIAFRLFLRACLKSIPIGERFLLDFDLCLLHYLIFFNVSSVSKPSNNFVLWACIAYGERAWSSDSFS